MFFGMIFPTEVLAKMWINEDFFLHQRPAQSVPRSLPGSWVGEWVDEIRIFFFLVVFNKNC